MCHYLGGGLHGRQKRVKAQSESSKSVVNSVLISREKPVFPGFLEIIRVVHRTKQIVASEYRDEGSIPIVDQSRAFVAGYTNDLEARVDFGIPIIVFGDHTRIVKLIQFPFAKGADGTQLIISDCLEMPQRLLYCSIMNVDLSNYHYARHFKYLKEEKIMIPTVKVANEFENNVTGIFSKIQNCRDEIIRCQKTRNLLLPKLMSGEVEV